MQTIKTEKICRACLCDDEKMIDMNEKDLYGKFLLFTNLAAQEEISDIPLNLCESCERKLNVSFEFQDECRKSHEFLVNRLKNSSEASNVDYKQSLDFQEDYRKSNEFLVNRVDLETNDDDSKEMLQKLNVLLDPHEECGKSNEFVVYRVDVSSVATDDDCKESLPKLNVLLDSQEECQKSNEFLVNAFKVDSETIDVDCKTSLRKLSVSSDFQEEVVLEATDVDCHKWLQKMDSYNECKNTEFVANHVENSCDVDSEPTDVKSLQKIDSRDECRNAEKKSWRLDQFPQDQVRDEIEELQQRFYVNKKCVRCSYVGTNLRALSLHITRMHKELKSHWCCMCNGEFDNLSDHTATNHTNDYTCKLCGRKFQTSGNLIVHLHHHSDVKQFRCSLCKKHFTKQYYLNLHMKKSHKSEDDADKQPEGTMKLRKRVRAAPTKAAYQCKYCEKKCKTYNCLVTHTRMHTGEKPYACHVCGRSFAQTNSLKTHLMIHNIGRRISCKICDQKLCTPNQLRIHVRRHTGEKPFVCTECGKGFVTRSSLGRHSIAHSDLRPHRCSHCDKSFKENSKLKLHMLIHLGEKPYKCNQCVYACRDSNSLTKHMSNHVADKPRTDRPHVCLICNGMFSTDAMLTSHIKMHNVSFLEI